MTADQMPDEIYVVGGSVTVNGSGKTVIGMYSDTKPEEGATKYIRAALATRQQHGRVDALVKSVQAVINGDAWTVKKNEKCKHEQYGYEGCENCTAEYLTEALRAFKEE